MVLTPIQYSDTATVTLLCCASRTLKFISGYFAYPDSMAFINSTSQFAHAEDSSSVDAQWPTLGEYTKRHSARSNDCDWLHRLVSSDAISAGKITPRYLVRVFYKEASAASETLTKIFSTGSSELLDLRHFLASKLVRAVTLCHRDSSQVDPEVLDLLWSKFKLDVSFMRQHFDYKEFKDEQGCPQVIRDRMEEESGMVEDYWTFGGRWNPVRLPSETRASVLRLSVDSERLSVSCRGDIGKSAFYQLSSEVRRLIAELVIALVRSKAVYQIPLSPWERSRMSETPSFSCANDLFAATMDMSSINHEPPSDSSEFSSYLMHFYARLLVLRCYEDYYVRHDPEPIHLDESDRVTSQHHPHILAIQYRRLELVKLKQDLFGHLGPLAPKQRDSGSAIDRYRRRLHSLLTDVDMLLSLYDNAMRIYECFIHEINSDYKDELASEQLEEARASKNSAISLGELSKLAFFYLPLNFTCAMLGMNLSVYGQGTVPVWGFLILVVLFSLLTYIPIYGRISERRLRLYKVAYHLTWWSFRAGFWFLAFSLTHDYRQNFELMNSGLAQVFLGYTGSRTKGWRDDRQDTLFAKATWGSQAFWKKKVKILYGAVEELDTDVELTQLTV